MILEEITLVEGWPIVDLKTGANSGDYVSMKEYGRVLIVLAASAGAAGEPPTIAFAQATDVAGTSSKALTITGTGYSKSAATDLSGTGNFTATAITAASTFSADTDGSKDKLWCVEIRSTQLDVNNGFDCIRATVADVGATAQLGYLLYILGEPRDPRSPDNMMSAIVN